MSRQYRCKAVWHEDTTTAPLGFWATLSGMSERSILHFHDLSKMSHLVVWRARRLAHGEPGTSIVGLCTSVLQGPECSLKKGESYNTTAFN